MLVQQEEDLCHKRWTEIALTANLVVAIMCSIQWGILLGWHKRQGRGLTCTKIVPPSGDVIQTRVTAPWDGVVCA